jgi:hypothetical protein
MSADSIWPPGLTRAARVADLEVRTPEVVARSEVDVGPAKIRRRFTGDRRTFTIGLDFTRTELSTFDAFFLTTTKGGSLSFAWELPRTGAVADFRFLGPPAYRPQAPRGAGGEWWRVSFDVEMLPGTDSSIVPPVDPDTPPAWVYGPVILDEDDGGGGGPGPDAGDTSAIVSGYWNLGVAAGPDVVPDLLFLGHGARPIDDEVVGGDVEDEVVGEVFAKSSIDVWSATWSEETFFIDGGSPTTAPATVVDGGEP